jgi:hypothetical protein
MRTKLRATCFWRPLAPTGWFPTPQPKGPSRSASASPWEPRARAGADLFSKVCGFSHRPRPRAADLQNGSALRSLLAQLRMPALRRLPDNPVILSVRSDPEPVDSLFDIGSQRSIMFADAHGPKIA